MDKRPKRRKAEDNPYTLSSYIKKGKYFVSFKDINGNFQNIEISCELYEAFNEFELQDISQMNKYDRHIEHSEQYEESINKRTLRNRIQLEDLVLSKISNEEIIREIWKLPVPQNRRVYMWVENQFTYTEIAKIEKRDISAIKRSIEAGLEKLRKKLKNF